MASTESIAPVDKKTFTIELGEHFGPVLDALGALRAAFMMPARIASTPPDQQIKEIVGSGPFKFAQDEWQPGEQAVYLRNPDYIPRDEAPSGSTGGKRVYLDKVIWRYMPEPWDAAEDLAAGNVDSRPSILSPRSNRTQNCKPSLTTDLGRKVGSDRTGCILRSIIERLARHCNWNGPRFFDMREMNGKTPETRRGG